MDTPSRGGAIISPSPIIHPEIPHSGHGKLEVIDTLRQEILELRQNLKFTSLESEQARQAEEEAERQRAENEELKRILDAYKSKFGLLDAEDANSGSEIPELIITTAADLVTGNEIHLQQDNVRNYGDDFTEVHDEWSFDIGDENAANATVRSGLLEKVYQMAKQSEEFKAELVDNMVILLKSKEMTAVDLKEKSELQTEIDKCIQVREKLAKNFEEEFDDMDQRINACFEGISEFQAFSKHFQEELDEIKRMNEVSVHSPSKHFSPIVSSSPLSAKTTGNKKESCKFGDQISPIRDRASRVTFKEHNLSRSVSVRRRRSSVKESGPCKDCARYRILLKSFETTQEADRQKQIEQERTIEKLSNAITSTKRYPRLSSMRAERMDMMKSLEKSDSDFDISAKRLQFDSPINQAFSAFRSRLNLGNVGASAEKTPVMSPGASPMKFRTVEDDEETTRLRKENSELRKKVIDLEQKSLRQQYFSPPKDLEEQLKRDVTKLSHDLNQATFDAAELRQKVSKVECEKLRLITELKQTSDDVELALEQLETKDTELQRLKLENENLRNSLNDRASNSANSSASLRIPSPKRSPVKLDFSAAYEMLKADYAQLETICDDLQQKNTALQSHIASLSKAPSPTGELMTLKRELKTAQDTIASVKKENEMLNKRIKNLSEEMSKEPPELSKLRKENVAHELETANLKKEVNKANGAVKELESKIETLRKEISSLKVQKAEEMVNATQEREGLKEQLREKEQQVQQLRDEVDRLCFKIDALKDENKVLRKTGEEMEKDFDAERKNFRDALLNLDRKVFEYEKMLSGGDSEPASDGFKDVENQDPMINKNGTLRAMEQSFVAPLPVEKNRDERYGIFSKIFQKKKNRKPRRSNTFTGIMP